MKFRKCEFWLEKISFLRHAISKDEIIVDPSKVIVVEEWKTLISVRKVKSFLSLASYY